MQKKFVSTLLLLLFLNLLVKPAWIFGIDLSVQNRVGAEEYGLYFALFNISMMFNILLDFGLTHYNNQAVARNSRKVKVNFSHLTSLKIMLGLLYLLITVVLGIAIGYKGPAALLLLILAINQFLASLVLFFRSNLAGLQHFRLDSILSVIDKVLMILICGTLLFGIYGEGFTVFHFAWAQTGSYLLTVIIAFIMVWRKVRMFKLKASLKSYRKGLRKSFPYALLILLMFLYTRVDGVMLERMVGEYENGVYAAAFRLLDAVNQLGYLFAVLLLPMFARMLSRNENVNELSRLSFNIIFILLLSVSLASYFNAGPIMDSLYVLEDDSLAPVFQLLILSSLAFGTTFVFGTLLTAAGQLKMLNIIAVTGFVINVGLNLILIPKYGAEGAAFATLITQSLTALVQVVVSYRSLKMTLSRDYKLRFGFFVLAAIITAFAFDRLLPVSFIIKFILIGFSVLLLSVMLGLLNYRSAFAMIIERIRQNVSAKDQ